MKKSEFKFYENVPGIIGIKTNVKNFFWGFGACEYCVSEKAFERCKIKVNLEVRPDRTVFDDIALSEYNYQFRHFKAAPEKNSVIFSQTVKRAVKLKYVLTVDGNTVNMVVGKSYLKLVKTKLMYVHPVAFILFDVVSFLLLKNGMTTLYCSAVYLPGGKSVVFSAPPNTGKSLCALKLRKDFGAEIVAEDMAVTDGVSLWGASQTNLYRNYNDKSLLDFDSSKFRSKLDSIDYLTILQKGESANQSKADDFYKKFLLINRYSLGYYYSPCVRVLCFFNQSMSTDDAQRTEELVLKRLMKNAECNTVINPNSMEFSSRIMALIDSANGGESD